MTKGLHFTPEQYEQLLARQAQHVRAPQQSALVHTTPPIAAPAHLPAPAHTPGTKNKTEAAYETEVLEVGKAAGVYLHWEFEYLGLRLAKHTFYHPDYFVITPTHFEVHEVKGIWRDDARVKIKVAAQQSPWFKFYAVRKRKKADGGGWDVEYISIH